MKHIFHVLESLVKTSGDSNIRHDDEVEFIFVIVENSAELVGLVFAADCEACPKSGF